MKMITAIVFDFWIVLIELKIDKIVLFLIELQLNFKLYTESLKKKKIV